MKNGWTGGQYSVVRAVLGAYLCGQLVPLIPSDAALAGSGVVAAIFFLVGKFDRTAALVCLAVVATLFLRGPLAENAAIPFVGWLLLLHLAAPPAPYGSIAARGRLEPGGGWTLPRAVFAATWIGLAAGYLTFGMGVWRVAAGGMLVVHLFAFDPAWVRGARPGTEVLFFDGHCGLCHRLVRFALAEAPEQDTLLFAPLFGETYRERIPADMELPDSVAMVTADGNVLLRSEASRHLGARLGGYWRVLSGISRVVPTVVADWIYDRIARVRHRLFRKPTEACPVLPPALRQRILP